MSLQIKLKISAVIIITAAAIAGMYLINDAGTINLSKNFFQGLVFGLVSTAMVVWLISLLVTLNRRKKTIEPAKIEEYNRQLIAGIGWLCLLTGIFLTRMEGAGEIIYIISSIFFVVSIILMTSYLTKMKKRRSEDPAV